MSHHATDVNVETLFKLQHRPNILFHIKPFHSKEYITNRPIIFRYVKSAYIQL